MRPRKTARNSDPDEPEPDCATSGNLIGSFYGLSDGIEDDTLYNEGYNGYYRSGRQKGCPSSD
jgi:hypothetical protein